MRQVGVPGRNGRPRARRCRGDQMAQLGFPQAAARHAAAAETPQQSSAGAGDTATVFGYRRGWCRMPGRGGRALGETALLRRSDSLAAKQAPGERVWSIPTHLIAVALASTVPIAVVAGALAYHLLSVAAQNQRHDVEERLRLLRDAVEMRLANVIEDLQVLARSPALQDGHLEEFRRHAVEASSVIGAIGLVMVDRDGQQVLSTRAPWGASLPRRRDLDTQERAFATGAAQVSDLAPTTSDGQPIISVEVPVQIAGTARYVLAAGLSPNYLSELMAQYVPPDMIGSIIDRKGILIARQ